MEVERTIGTVRLLIAEDQYLMREGIRSLLAEEPTVEVVGVAGDLAGVIDEAERLCPDVVLMDVRMPPTFTMEGISAAHAIKRRSPSTGVLVLSQHDDEEYVWALFEKGFGGLGFLHKVRLGDLGQLVRGLHEVANGGSVVDPRILESLVQRRVRKPGSPLARLTPGELDTLRLMADSCSNAAIGSRLSISVATVEKRIAAVFSKLGLAEEPNLNRRVAAVLLYLRESALGA